MNSTQHYKLLILGSGPSGLTAAIYAARANLAPAILHGPLAGGQLTTTTEIENFPGFPEGIMGSELMEAMEKQARRFGAEVLVDSVTEADLSSRPFKLKTQDGVLLTCEALIVATGASARMLGLEEEKELLGYGVSTCATCDGAFFRNKVVAVAGGGDSACEEAVFLTKFASKVFLIHRRDELRASKIMQQRVLNHPKIEVLWNKRVTQIRGSKKDGVTGLTLFDVVTNDESSLDCEGIFIAIGHVPNSSLFKGALEMDKAGYLIR
ncbi:MAG: FAD-dependent oxidoreductase, partial [Deltaproteobacteria bacterium]|nr:FAD-dependent oxidoreductase [Deltaproteobacteria bacterium]